MYGLKPVPFKLKRLLKKSLWRQMHKQRLKPDIDFAGFCGPFNVVPLLQNPHGCSFSATSEAYGLIYRWDMGRSFTRRSCVLAWLLCALLVCLAIHSPHCDLCDGPLVMQLSSSQSHVSHSAPIGPDGCNDMCWCCAFLAVPSIAPGAIPEQRFATALWPEPPSLVLDRSLSIDRPPRIAVSI